MPSPSPRAPSTRPGTGDDPPPGPRDAAHLGRTPAARLLARGAHVIEVGSRRRTQPAPPHVLYEALTQPDRDPARPWLLLLDDEVRPVIVTAEPPGLVVWSSPWQRRPDARVHFELPGDRSGHGTDLRWRLLVEGPPPDASLLGHMRRRLNELVNAELRHTFGQ